MSMHIIYILDIIAGSILVMFDMGYVVHCTDVDNRPTGLTGTDHAIIIALPLLAIAMLAMPDMLRWLPTTINSQ